MNPESAARAASWLFVAGGLLTVVSAELPGTPNPGTARFIGLAAALVGLLVRAAPWARWPRQATLALVLPALVLISVGNRSGSAAPYGYAVYFIVVFTWVGLSQPRRTSAMLCPIAGLFYLVPFFGAPHIYPGAVASTFVAIPVCVLVGETVAWAVDGLREARREADHRADLLRTVARATATITALEWDHVLSGVVDAVTGLGFEIAALAMFDDSSDTYTFLHARGLPDDYAARSHPAAQGFPGTVRRERQTVAVDHRATDAPLMSRLEETGLRAVIANPVWVHGHLAAVLVAGTHTEIDVLPEDIEAFDLLAMHAGRALENARRYSDERHAREQLAEVSMLDELTGIGNRRHAVRMLDEIKPGDAVIIIDLDHFKNINDRDGHATGDAVLIQLADHLRTNVRDPHMVSRYGGDEFLVILPHTDRALVVAERLVESWQHRSPTTTISAGVAVHELPNHPASTVANADTALYAAKRLGRNRVCEYRIALPELSEAELTA